jgi:hypothetical protein
MNVKGGLFWGDQQGEEGKERILTGDEDQVKCNTMKPITHCFTACKRGGREGEYNGG